MVQPIDISLQQHQVITRTYEHTLPNMHVGTAITLVWAEFKIIQSKLSKLTKHTVQSDTTLHKIGRKTPPKMSKL